MTTLTTKCEKHNPFRPAISSVGFDAGQNFTFCQNCEQNIENSFWYDEDRGWRESVWVLSN